MFTRNRVPLASCCSRPCIQPKTTLVEELGRMQAAAAGKIPEEVLKADAEALARGQALPYARIDSAGVTPVSNAPLQQCPTPSGPSRSFLRVPSCLQHADAQRPVQLVMDCRIRLLWCDGMSVAAVGAQNMLG